MQFSFDATNIDISDNRSFEPIPHGKYTAMVVKAEELSAREGTGKFLFLTCQVIEGPYTNRTVFYRLTTTNDNAEAVKIGKKDLAILMNNMGIGPVISDTQELQGKPFIMGVKVTQSEQYGLGNAVTFTAKAAGQPGMNAPQMAAPMGRPQAPAATSAAPWG